MLTNAGSVATSALTRPPKELPLSSGPKSTGMIVRSGTPCRARYVGVGSPARPVAQAAYSS